MNNEVNANRKSPALGLFGKIYYPVLALVAAVLLVLSFVTYYTVSAPTDAGFDTAAAVTRAEELAGLGERNTWHTGTGSTTDYAVNTIDGWLAGTGIVEQTASRAEPTVDKDDGEDMDITASYADGYAASYTWVNFAADDIDYTVDADTVRAMTKGDFAGYEGTAYAGAQPNDLVIVIPGTDTKAGEAGDAVLLMTHYDSDSGSSAFGGASAAAAMISVAENIAKGDAEYKNDLVFVVTDGRYESSVGAYAFLYQFVGYDNIVSRIDAAFNFDAITSDGTLTVLGTSDNDSGIMGAYMASSASARVDTSVMGMAEDVLSTDMDAFFTENSSGDVTWRFPAMNIVLSGGAHSEISPATEEAETAWKNSDATAQFAAQMSAIAAYFGDIDVSALGGASTNTAGYSWMGTSGIATGPAVYAMSAVLVVMIAAAIALGVKFKGFGIVRALKGAGAVILVMGFSLAAFAAAYFLLGSLMAAFGVITVNMLTTARMMGPALLVPALLFAAAVSCGLYPILKKGFKVKAADCVRGGALLTAVLGAAFGFIYPQAALPFVITGLAMTAVMIASTLLKMPFKSKFGFGIERLFLYAIPAMFALPFMISTMLMAGTLVATVSVIFLMLAVTLLLSSITPYFDYLQPVMTDAFEKLPKHVVPVIETVTEDVEDAAKKGKFTTVTEQRLVKHKVAWRYHNWFGVLVLCLVTIAALLVSCTLGAYANTTFALNRTTDFGYDKTDIRDSIFDNAVVCYIDGSSSSRYSWLIKDEAVYRNIKYIDSDYDYWNWDRTEVSDLGEAYRLDVNTELPVDTNFLTKPDSDSKPEGYDVINITPIDASSSQVYMTISGIENGDRVTIYDGSQSGDPDDITADVIFDMTFYAPADDIEIVLPYGQGECTMYVETDGSVSGEGYCVNNSGNLANSSALTDYRTMSSGMQSVFDYSLRVAQIIRDNT